MTSFYNKVITTGELLQKVSFTFIVKILGAIIAFFLQLLLARILGSEEYGSYLIIFIWINILTVISTLGLDRLSIRVSSVIQFGTSTSKYNGFHLGAILVIFVTSTFVSLVAFFAYGFLSENNELNKLFIIALFAIPFIAVSLFNSGTLQGLKKPVYAELSRQVIRQLLMLIAVGALLTLKIKIEAEQAILLLVGAAIVTSIVSFYWLYKNRNFINLNRRTFQFKAWIAESLPFVIITGSQLIRKNIDIIIVGYYLGVQSAGYYGAATRITNLISFGTGAINTVTAPQIAENFILNKRTSLIKIIQTSGNLILLYATLAFFVILIIGKWVLQLFGNDFITVYPILMVLAGSQIINALFGPTGTLASMTNNQNYSSKVIGISAVFNIIVNIFFIKHFGLMGAACTSILTNVLWNTLLVIYLNKKIKINSIVFFKKG